MSLSLPRLYADLAPWFHLLTHPDEYEDEAAAYRDTWLRLLREAGFDIRHSSRPNDSGEPDEVFVGLRPQASATAG